MKTPTDLHFSCFILNSKGKSYLSTVCFFLFHYLYAEGTRSDISISSNDNKCVNSGLLFNQLFLFQILLVLNAVCFLLGNPPASKFYMPTFRNTVCSIFIGRYEDVTDRVFRNVDLYNSDATELPRRKHTIYNQLFKSCLRNLRFCYYIFHFYFLKSFGVINFRDNVQVYY
jgi:hypothetical protein